MNPKNGKKVLFASAKNVCGATKKRKKPYFIRTLKFRGAFPYPVVIKILTIFRNEGKIWHGNRIIYRKNIQKKLLEQFYTDIEFPIDKDVKIEPGLVRFCEKNNFYSNKIMD